MERFGTLCTVAFVNGGLDDLAVFGVVEVRVMRVEGFGEVGSGIVYADGSTAEFLCKRGKVGERIRGAAYDVHADYVVITGVKGFEEIRRVEPAVFNGEPERFPIFARLFGDVFINVVVGKGSLIL